MITGIKKTHKTTEIFFDEGSDILIINTYNTSIKNRLTAYARIIPTYAVRPMTTRWAASPLQ